MFLPGIVVATKYPSDEIWFGIIATPSELSRKDLQKVLFKDWDSQFLVRFRENGENVYDVVSSRNTRHATREDLAGDTGLSSLNAVRDDFRQSHICEAEYGGIRVLVHVTMYPHTLSLVPPFQIGLSMYHANSLCYEYPISTRYIKALTELSQQSGRGEGEMSKLAVLAYDQLHHFMGPAGVAFDGALDVVLGRTPNHANYSEPDYFGNVYLEEFPTICDAGFNVVSRGDLMASGSRIVRADRFILNGFAKTEQLLIVGLQLDLANPYLSEIVAQNGTSVSALEAGDSELNRLLDPVVYPSTALTKIQPESLAEKIAGVFSNENWPEGTVSSLSAAFLSMIQKQYKPVLHKILSSSILSGDTTNLFTGFTNGDMNLGTNFLNPTDINISGNDDELTMATPLEALLADLSFVQGHVIRLDDSEGINPLDYKLSKSFLLTVPSSQIVQSKTLLDAFNSVVTRCTNFEGEGKLDWLNLSVPEDALLSDIHYALRDTVAADYSRLSVQAQQLCNLSGDILCQRGMRCCYCGNKLLPGENTIGPYVYALQRTAEPLCKGSYLPPVLLMLHETCAYYTPEIVSCNMREILESYVKSEIRVIDPFTIPAPSPIIIKAVAFDKVSRYILNTFPTYLYFNIRKTLRRNRFDVKCSICGQPGALIGCYNKNCTFTAHYPCLMKEGLKFGENRELLCKKHAK